MDVLAFPTQGELRSFRREAVYRPNGPTPFWILTVRVWIRELRVTSVELTVGTSG